MWITMDSIFKYTEAEGEEETSASTSSTKRSIKEGLALYLGDHVLICGLQGKKVVARCLTSKLTAEPHEIEIMFNEFSDCRKWNCKCTCKAGKGETCKHIIAVLIFVYKAENLIQLSCTDVRQKWGKEKREVTKQLSEATAVENFCHVKQAQNTCGHAMSLSFQSQFFLQCLKAVPESEAAVHFAQRQPRRQHNDPEILELRLYHNKIEGGIIKAFAILLEISTCLIVDFSLLLFFFVCFRDHDTQMHLQLTVCNNSKNSIYAKFLYNMDVTVVLQRCCIETYNQNYPCELIDICTKTLNNKESWKQHRAFRVTATRCYALYTYSLQDWTKKCREYFFPSNPFFGNANTEYGNEQEPFAKQCYSDYIKKWGCVVNYGLAVCYSNPWLGCSPDGIVFKNGKPYKLLEIKCPVLGKSKTITDCLTHLRYLKVENNHYKLKHKHTYYAQIQLSMAILNLTSCDFVIYSSFDNSMHVETIAIDNEFCINLLGRLKQIFFKYMLPTLCETLKTA